MGKTAVAFRLAGLAATGLGLFASSAVSAPHAPVVGLVGSTSNCRPGTLYKRTAKVTAKGGPLPRPLRAGDTIQTNSSGKAEFCVKAGSWDCTVWARSQVRVLPPGSPAVVLELNRGYVVCSTPLRPDKEIDAPGARLIIGGTVRSPASMRGTSAAARSGGQLVSIAVTKDGTVAKVQRGTTVVATKTTLETAVVVGKGQQSVAPRGADPHQPARAVLTKQDRAAFAELARTLPKDTDRTPPSVGIVQGPRLTSSVRTASFKFVAGEAATLSCALDGVDFRLCESPRSFDALKPGKHIFKVRATDLAGNTAETDYPWTVDASHIVFASFRDGNPRIWTAEPDGSNPFQVTRDSISDQNPDWSPDQQQIVYDGLADTASGGRNLDIYAINADGTGRRQLTTDPANDRNPAWSPDGSRIAFESDREGSRQLYVMNADGSNVRRLTNDSAEDLDPTWSPDSRRIAFASTRDNGNYEIYVMNADGSGQTNLTRDPSVEFGPSWSPDGRRIAFHSLRTQDYQHIFVMNADGSNVRQITKTQSSDTNPAWAPDSGHIVFQSNRQGGEPQLYVVDADTLEETSVADPLGRADSVPDW